VLPESTLFRRDRQEARASVSLKLKPGVVLQNAQIYGIQRLVVASVAGLELGRVVVTDQHGLTLSAADALSTGGTGEARLSMKREVEEYVARKIVALLDRAYGPGRAIVSVDATLNFDEVRRTVHDLLPPSGTTNVRRRRETTASAAAFDPASSFDGEAAPRGTTDTEYDYGRRVEQVVAAPGGVTRLSVGVIVPGSMEPATQARIEDLVRMAAGIDDARGDEVVVQSLDALGTQAAALAPGMPALPAVELDEVVTPAAAPADVKAAGWQSWYVWAAAGALLLALVLALLLRRPAGDSRLSAQERARLLADVKASLERNSSRMSPAAGAP